MSHFHVSVHLLLPPPDGFACLHTSSDGSGGDESVSKMAAEIETMAQAAEGNVEVGGASEIRETASCLANTVASSSF